VAEPLGAAADAAGALALATGAALGTEAELGTAVAPLLQAAKTRPAVASNAPARLIPNVD
jgi:hypothetical protein